jgi:Flp pilus assembly secretin CpaC
MSARSLLALGIGATLLLVGAGNHALAQPVAQLAPPIEPALVTVTYAVADLVVPIDLEPGEKKQPTATRELELMTLIRATVDPKSWSERGGSATLQYHSVGMGLVIQQSPPAHDKIRDLLKDLRRLQDVQVAVEIRLVNLTEGSMDKSDLKQGRDLSDIQVFQFLEAAQGDRSLNVMQAPKLTTFNGQKAKIAITDNHTYVTGIKLVGDNENLVAQPQIENVALGMSFSVRPVVSSDLRYVTMNLGVFLANLEGPVATTLVDTPAANGKRGQMLVHLPKVSKIEMEKTLKVADGATTIVRLGRRATENRSEFGPPILSKIPYMSRLFKNVAYGTQATELFLFVTPRLIIREEEEEVVQR